MSTPSRASSTPRPNSASTADNANSPATSQRGESAQAPGDTGILSAARKAARKLLGRDKLDAKKDDPNIYPLF